MENEPKAMPASEFPGHRLPAPLQPVWTKALDSREWSQVLHAQAYAKNHQGAGAPGHGQFLLIAKMASLLNALEPQADKPTIQRIAWNEEGKYWYDIITGVRVDLGLGGPE